MTTSGFWGLLVEPDKLYSQEVPATFKVTMASLGPDASADKSSQEAPTGRTTVMLRIKGQDDFAICSLTPGKLEQQPLDLVLTTGEKIGFRVSGPYPVYLTGYFVSEEAMMDDDDEGFINDASEAEEVDGEYDSEDESQYDSDEAKSAVKKILDRKRKRSVRLADSDSETESDGGSESEDDTEGESTGSHSDDFDDVNTSDLEELSEGDFEDFIDDEESEEESADEEIVPPGKRSNVPEQPSKKPDAKKSKVDVQMEKKPATNPQQPKQDTKQPVKVDVPNKPAAKAQQASPKTENVAPNDKQTNANKTPQPQQQQGNDKKTLAKKEQQNQQVTPKSEKVTTPNDKQATPNNNKAQPQPQQQQQQSSEKKALTRTLPSGLIIEDIVVGNGPKVAKDRRVGISYVGKLQSGKTFDKSQGKDLLYFTVGRGEVIKGMDMGIQGMCVGGKRKLTIPAPLAYGNQSTPGIPPNSTLIFELAVEKVGPAGK